eukprot:EG_transcript_13681
MSDALARVASWLAGTGLPPHRPSPGEPGDHCTLRLPHASKAFSTPGLSTAATEGAASKGCPAEDSAEMTAPLELPWLDGGGLALQLHLHRTVERVLAATECLALQGHVLAYALRRHFGWDARFFCEAHPLPISRSVPSAWTEGVVAFSPTDGRPWVIDLRFREKFAVGSLASSGPEEAVQGLCLVPDVYIGPLPLLMHDLRQWTAMLHCVFEASGLVLPPWRTCTTLRRLYQRLAEADTTGGQLCLAQLGQCVDADDDAAVADWCQCHRCAETSVVHDYTWALTATSDPLPTTSTASARLGVPHPLAEDPYDFEKEPFELQAEESISGLSSLLSDASGD